MPNYWDQLSDNDTKLGDTYMYVHLGLQGVHLEVLSKKLELEWFSGMLLSKMWQNNGLFSTCDASVKICVMHF